MKATFSALLPANHPVASRHPSFGGRGESGARAAGEVVGACPRLSYRFR
jgi:hypothetical protein